MIYPGVDTNMLGGYRTPLLGCKGLILHIAVSNSHWPSYLSGTAAHWYGRKDGSVGQQVDSRMRGGSSLNGNAWYHAMETQGGVGADVAGEWTEAQLVGMARIIRLSSDEWGWPLRLAQNSNDEGLAWHRLGIDGNFPATGILAGRLQRGGGAKWSGARGKVCPGDARILQIPRLLDMAKGIDTGAPWIVVPVDNPIVILPVLALTLGSHGPDVVRLQRFLGIPDDGSFGPQTLAAVKAYQAGVGLEPDGLVGPKTWAKVNAGVRPVAPPPPPAPVAPRFPLPGGYFFGPKSGPKQSVSGYYSYRDELRHWQQRMKDRGWNITPDGLYGDETKRVTLAFQAEKGLTVDGKIGPQTWAAAWTAPIT